MFQAFGELWDWFQARLPLSTSKTVANASVPID
jgi:hypothetical protein